MRITFLGSGCCWGIPAPFCNCRVCDKAENNPSSRDNRTRSSLLIEENGKKIIMDVTPDIRLQSSKFSINEVDAFLVTHWHWDHLFGLGELHYFAEENKVTVYGTNETKKWIDSRFSHIPLSFEKLRIGEVNNIHGVKVVPFRVEHTNESVGFLFIGDEKKLAYMCDFKSVPEESLEVIKECDILVTDGTYLENPVKEDDTHLKEEEVFDFINEVDANEVFIDRIACLSRKTHKELEEEYPNVKIAYDGLTITL